MGRNSRARSLAVAAVGFWCLLPMSSANAAIAPVSPGISPQTTAPVAPPAEPAPVPDPVLPQPQAVPAPEPATTTPTPSETPAPPGPASAWTSLRLTPDTAINAHTSDLTPEQLLSALNQPGAFSVNLRVDRAALPAPESILDTAWVDCPAKSWCGPDSAVGISTYPAGSQDVATPWSDYTGGIWAVGDPTGAASQLPQVAAPGNGLDLVTGVPASSAAASAEAAGAAMAATTAAPAATGATWLARLWPQLGDLARAPRAGQELSVNYLGGAQAKSQSIPVSLAKYPISVPVVNALFEGSLTADALVADNGRLAMSIWRPQRLTKSTKHVKDMAGLHYGVVISDGGQQVSCAPARYSAFTGVATDPAVTWNSPTAGPQLPLVDGLPMDLDPAESAPVGFTLDVAGCLTDAAAAGTVLGPELTASVLAADSAGASTGSDALSTPASNSAGVTYRLLVQP